MPFRIMLTDKHLLLISVMVMILSGVLSLPFLTRLLTADELGHVLLVLLLFNIIAAFDSLRPIVIQRYHDYRYSQFIGTINFLSIVFGIFFSSAYFFLLLFFDELIAVERVVLSLSTFLYFLISVLWGTLESRNHVGWAQMIRSLSWFLVYVAFIILSILSFPLYSYSIVLLFMNTFLWAMFFLKTEYKYDVKFKQAVFIELWRDVRNTMSFNFYRTIVDYFDRIIITKLLPLSQFAIYSAQVNTVIKINLLSQYTNQYIFPKLCKITKSSNQEMKKFWINVLVNVNILLHIIVFFTIFFSKEIVTLYLGDGYEQYSFVFVYSSIAVYLMQYSFFGISFLRSIGDFGHQEKCYRLFSILGIVSSYWLVSTYHMLGAVLVFIVFRLSSICIFEKVLSYFTKKQSLLLRFSVLSSLISFLTIKYYPILSLFVSTVVLFVLYYVRKTEV